MPSITVRKLDHTGHEVTAYPGEVLRREGDLLVLRTTWERALLDLGFVILETSSHWTEFFFGDRWYNIFQVHAGDGRLLGWYCNVTRPPCITASEVAAEDLALDLWVAIGGETTVLDEDEFAALPLDPTERAVARQALDELQGIVTRREAPFDAIGHLG